MGRGRHISICRLGKPGGPFVPAAAQPFSKGPGLVPTPLLNLVLIKIFFLLECVVLTPWVGILYHPIGNSPAPYRLDSWSQEKFLLSSWSKQSL